MASIVIKTPTRSINLTTKKEDQVLFFNEIENNIAKMCIGALSISAKKAYEDQISIIATFFQRLVARTPVDENYEKVYVTKDGEQKVVKHKPDREVCREHWFIEETKSGKKLYSKELFASPFSFSIVNDTKEINQIKAAIMAMCPMSQDASPSFAVGNDSRHFERLEYGYSLWKNDTGVSIGTDIFREHGVQNKHSVQAPVGMLRITQAEFESIRKRPSTKSLRSRYRSGVRTSTVPSEKKLREFVKIMKKSHRIKYADIKRFIEVY